MNNYINFHAQDGEFLFSWSTSDPIPLQIGQKILLAKMGPSFGEKDKIRVGNAEYEITGVSHSLQAARKDSIIIKTTYSMEVEVKRIEER